MNAPASPSRPLPNGPLVAFYGDDFTGSSASMEALAFAGLQSVLFLGPPPPDRLAAFAGYRGIGIAGVARARDPDWMEANLPPVFDLLAGLGAPVVHYKVCSTFDSAPHIGSIGRAIDIAARTFDGFVPLVVGEPGMGRFQAFGHLFANAQEKGRARGYRLDRHPTMARHPVTPMDEADLAVHLARQTARKIGLVDFVAMKRGEADARLSTELAEGAQVVLIDVLDAETLAEAGRLVWEKGAHPIFTVGSQGLETALVTHWRAAGLLPEASPPAGPKPAPRIAVVSGSVSPVTASQIAFAAEHGFAPIRLDAARAVDEAAFDAAVADAAASALAALSEGRDPLVYTAAGPQDAAVAALREAVAASGSATEAVNDRIGAGLGRVLDTVVREARLGRAVISGGDTSGQAAAALGIDALTALAPLSPGSPLCRAHQAGAGAGRDGLEIALKGGQVGTADFFVRARDGVAA
ncbi:four-carbon acid sugar kinase family protein [Xanthobacter sp. KR7-65]|uniref:four-carbon acid sugar kinase family protein n=1 Tax=Xanthobacter sp. KR7-65 TaxID=3156612 RepID=UPI0032B56A13